MIIDLFDDVWWFMEIYDSLSWFNDNWWTFVNSRAMIAPYQRIATSHWFLLISYIYIYPVVYPHELQAYASKISQKHHDYMSNHDDIPWISFFEYPMYRNSPTAIMVISCHILWNSHESPSKSGELERHKSCSRVWKLKISCESWRPKRTSILDFQGTWHRGKNRGFMGYSWEMRGTFILDYEISGINGIW